MAGATAVAIPKAEGRTIKWLVNNAVRKEILAEEALKQQPDLFKSKKA